MDLGAGTGRPDTGGARAVVGAQGCGRGRWAICSNDPEFQGTGNPDTGEA